MELNHVWDTPYTIKNNPQNLRKEYKSQKVDDEMIEIVSYKN